MLVTIRSFGHGDNSPVGISACAGLCRLAAPGVSKALNLRPGSGVLPLCFAFWVMGPRAVAETGALSPSPAGPSDPFPDQAGGSAGPTSCVGFCFGGHLALLAATLPAIGATCAFYGARVSSFRPGGGPPSLELVPQIPGRLWCFCGDQDPLIPPEEIRALAAALKAANGGVPAESEAARHRLRLAPGAGHGYMGDAHADFSPAASRSGWSAMLGLFAALADAAPSPQD